MFGRVIFLSSVDRAAGTVAAAAATPAAFRKSRRVVADELMLFHLWSFGGKNLHPS